MKKGKKKKQRKNKGKGRTVVASSESEQRKRVYYEGGLRFTILGKLTILSFFKQQGNRGHRRLRSNFILSYLVGVPSFFWVNFGLFLVNYFIKKFMDESSFLLEFWVGEVFFFLLFFFWVTFDQRIFFLQEFIYMS